MNYFRASLVVAFAGIFAALGSIVGCGGAPETGKTVKDPKRKNTAWVRHLARLQGIFDSDLQPSKLPILRNPTAAAERLNAWAEAARSDGIAPSEAPELASEAQAWITRQLGGELAKTAIAEIQRTAYGPENAEYIRDCLLFQAIVNSVAQGKTSDLDGVGKLFQYTIHNIELVAEDDVLAFSPYEILLFGKGTAEDRAWIFTELVRQLTVDTVIVTAKNSADANAKWLVGVLLNEKTYLFDCRVGAVVPGPESHGELYNTPATLAQATGEDALLNEFYEKAGLSDVLTADDLKVPQALAVGGPHLWAPRIGFVHQFLSGKRFVPLFERVWGQGDNAVVQRLMGTGQLWSKDDLGLWPHPFARLAARRTPDKLAFEKQWRPFSGPVDRTIDPSTKRTVRELKTKNLWKSRIRQLNGELDKSIVNYSSVQTEVALESRLPVPGSPGLRAAQQQTARYAKYWIGVCYMERGWRDGYKDAITQLNGYLRDNKAGRHAGQCRLLLAECYIAQKKPKLAIETLQAMPKSDPLAPAAAYRINVWKKE